MQRRPPAIEQSGNKTRFKDENAACMHVPVNMNIHFRDPPGPIPAVRVCVRPNVEIPVCPCVPF